MGIELLLSNLEWILFVQLAMEDGDQIEAMNRVGGGGSGSGSGRH